MLRLLCVVWMSFDLNYCCREAKWKLNFGICLEIKKIPGTEEEPQEFFCICSNHILEVDSLEPHINPLSICRDRLSCHSCTITR